MFPLLNSSRTFVLPFILFIALYKNPFLFPEVQIWGNSPGIITAQHLTFHLLQIQCFNIQLENKGTKQ